MMNNKYYNKISIYITLIMGVLGVISCTDYLDKSPLADIDPDDVYKNFKNFQGFTEELYNCIPVVSASEYHSNWNFGEDEYWEPQETRLLAYHINQGNYWAWNTAYYSWFKTGGNPTNQSRFNKGALWGLSWYGIRKANLGLANMDKLIDATNEEKNLIEGQLYFFRGWFHFMLMQYWGGLPYIDQVLPSDQVLRLPRLNYQATAEKAAEDFQRAADLLPIDWDQTTPGRNTLGNNNLRINKIMALAYLGKNLLWAGSPLMNYESTGNRSYNTEYCKRAANAFAQALKLCESTGRYELADFSRYTEIFYTYNQSTKFLVERSYLYGKFEESGARWRWNQVKRLSSMTLIASGIKVYPTANYVDYYGIEWFLLLILKKRIQNLVMIPISMEKQDLVFITILYSMG